MTMAGASPTAADPGPDADTEARRIQGLLEGGQIAEAVAAAALSAAPTHRPLLYALAVGQRLAGRPRDALATLERLEDAFPDYPRLYQERGHCYVALRLPEAAIKAYESAVTRSAALPASWNALQRLYPMVGRTLDAETAGAHVRKLASLPADIVTACSMYADGEHLAAETRIRQYLLTHGDHIEAMRLLARIGADFDILDDAEVLLEGVLHMAPDYQAARYEYALVLQKEHKHATALAQIDLLLQQEPHNRVYRSLRAAILAGMGRHQESLPLYDQLLLEAPTDPDLWLGRAHLHKTMGNQTDAISDYQQAARIRPQFGDAYWSLANLKTYRFSDDELQIMRAQVDARRLADADRYHLCFALGKALEDRGEYAESWNFYARGNALKLRECRYQPEIIESNTRLQKQICSGEFFAARQAWGCDSEAPIFIVGLPRSGSTLVEQILASHSQVEGTMELANVHRFVHELRGRLEQQPEGRYPAVLADLSADAVRSFGQRYIDETRVYRKLNRHHFIDKMPNNFRHLGLIALILPRAKIIDARREPMACCFSNFKQLFASGQQFSYDLEHLARYYRTYVELMAHWEAVLPHRILRVQHEDLVGNLEPGVRRILDFCELEFEPGCVNFHQTERAVHTASSEQVRRPISAEGINQWRHFEPWLGPLHAALGDVLTRYRN
jgi:predicted Zn-dependent protease